MKASLAFDGTSRIDTLNVSPDEAPPEVLTVRETAALLRVQPNTIYLMIQEGKLPGVRRLGAAIRVHRRTLLDWLASDKSGSRARR